METLRLTGEVAKGKGWVTGNWLRILLAHRPDVPDIDQFQTGTLNIELDQPWIPPGDERHRAKAHERGIALKEEFAMGADFLANGNYIHPDIAVQAINGYPVDGIIYFSGIPKSEWQGNDSEWAKPRRCTKIEILSKTHIRSLLGIRSDEVCRVEVEMVIR